MKFFVPFVAAIAGFAAAAPVASDDAVAKRETVTIQQFMSALTTQVKQHTGAMNKTLAALPANASEEQKKVAAASVIEQINGLTNVFHTANTKVAAAQKSNTKRAGPTLGDLPHDVLGQLDGQPIVLAKLLLPVIQELDPALQSVLVTLSLGEVYTALQPLLKTELPNLVRGLGNLVNGLLVALGPLLAGVGGILSPLLLGLGL